MHTNENYHNQTILTSMFPKEGAKTNLTENSRKKKRIKWERLRHIEQVLRIGKCQTEI